MNLTVNQKKLINNDLHIYRYVYNKSINYIKDHGHSYHSYMNLRDLLVTKETKKHNKEYTYYKKIINLLNSQLKSNLTNKNFKNIVKNYILKNNIKKDIEFYNKEFKNSKKTMSKKTNIIINDFELNTDKNIRTSAVKSACSSFKSANTNLREGNIKKFNISYKKKKDNNHCMEIPKLFIKKDSNNKLYFTNKKFKDNKFINIGNRMTKNIIDLQLDHDMKILKNKSNYYLIVPIKVQDNNDLNKSNRIIGIDPGIKTFLTGFDSDCNIIEYNIDYSKINKLNNKYSNYKELNKRKRKRTYNKIENKQKNLIDEYHWKSIRYILTNYDYIMFGKLDSQGFVKNGKNKKLNKQTNDLKPYLFRQRLLFKSNELNKYTKIINERYTTKTCSNCGNIYDIKTSRIYECVKCKKSHGRDINSAKNILMRGILN